MITHSNGSLIHKGNRLPPPILLLTVVKFGHYFAADEVTKLNLGQDYEARFGQDFNLILVEMLMFGSDFKVNS